MEAPASGGSTRLEGEVASGAGYFLFNLPPELAGKYQIVEKIGFGAEGVALKVADPAGVQFVVKLYLRDTSFDKKTLRLLAKTESSHVVEIVETGTYDGSRYEVLEWCRYGSLRDQMASGRHLVLEDAVGELSKALEHIHSLRLADYPDARLVHQDLKPENVFVRSLEPFNLVLGDFGLVRLIAGSRHLTDRQQGSRAYAPPLGEAVSAGWDWWSLGMMIAELAGGSHPFCINGEWLSDKAISDLLSQGPVDLSAVQDPRVQRLCRGLLTRRGADRWGAAEVRRWLAGENVAVAVDSPARDRVVLFNGREYPTPADLALGLQQDWDRALEVLIQRNDGGNLSQQVGLLLSSFGLSDAERLLADASNPPSRLANLLVEMREDLPPLYRGVDIRPKALAAQITDPASAVGTVELVENKRYGLAEVGVMSCWWRLEGMDAAPETEARLRSAKAFLASQKACFDQLRLSDSIVCSLKASVYLAALQPQAVERARLALDARDDALAGEQGWWQAIKDEASEWAAVLALALESNAAERTRLEHAQAEEAKRLADQRRREQQELTGRRNRLQEQRDSVTRSLNGLPTQYISPLATFGYIVGALVLAAILNLPIGLILSLAGVNWYAVMGVIIFPVIAGCVAVPIAWSIVRVKKVNRRRELESIQNRIESDLARISRGR